MTPYDPMLILLLFSGIHRKAISQEVLMNLTHCGLVLATEIWVNIGSGDGLLPDSTKPLSKPMLTDHHLKSSDIHSRAISQEMPQPSITKIRLKITYLKFHSNFSGANELIYDMCLQLIWRSGPHRSHRCTWPSNELQWHENERVPG